MCENFKLSLLTSQDPEIWTNIFLLSKSDNSGENIIQLDSLFTHVAAVQAGLTWQEQGRRI